jgi:hypothetical protein
VCDSRYVHSHRPQVVLKISINKTIQFATNYLGKSFITQNTYVHEWLSQKKDWEDYGLVSTKTKNI